MSLFIVIAVILVILYILSRLFEWVSDHKEAVLGFFCLVALIALICFYLRSGSLYGRAGKGL